MIPQYAALLIAWSAVVSSALLVAQQAYSFDPARAPLIPLNMIVAGVFFLVAK